MIPFHVGLLWYYSLRKILVPNNNGVKIQYTFKKSKIIKWSNVKSIEHQSYGKQVWTMKYNENDSIIINCDCLDSIKHAAKFNGVKIIE